MNEMLIVRAPVSEANQSHHRSLCRAGLDLTIDGCAAQVGPEDGNSDAIRVDGDMSMCRRYADDMPAT